ELSLPTPLLPPSQQNHRPSLRSNRDTLRFLRSKRLSRKAASHPLFRSANQQSSGFSNQQFYLTGFNHRPIVSMPMAGGIVLQMDQATLSYQGLLWHQRETDLDCHLDLRVGGDRQKALESRSQLVLDSTDSERDDHGENSAHTSTFTVR